MSSFKEFLDTIEYDSNSGEEQFIPVPALGEWALKEWYRLL